MVHAQAQSRPVRPPLWQGPLVVGLCFGLGYGITQRLLALGLPQLIQLGQGFEVRSFPGTSLESLRLRFGAEGQPIRADLERQRLEEQQRQADQERQRQEQQREAEQRQSEEPFRPPVEPLPDAAADPSRAHGLLEPPPPPVLPPPPALP